MLEHESRNKVTKHRVLQARKNWKNTCTSHSERDANTNNLS